MESSWGCFFFSPYFVYSFPFPEICVLLGGALIACSVKIMEQLYIRKKKVLFFLPKCSEHLFESINILHAKKKKNQNVSSDVKVFFFPYFFPPCLVYANQPVPHFYKEVARGDRIRNNFILECFFVAAQGTDLVSSYFCFFAFFVCYPSSLSFFVLSISLHVLYSFLYSHAFFSSETKRRAMNWWIYFCSLRWFQKSAYLYNFFSSTKKECCFQQETILTSTDSLAQKIFSFRWHFSFHKKLNVNKSTYHNPPTHTHLVEITTCRKQRTITFFPQKKKNHDIHFHMLSPVLTFLL